MKRTNKRYAVQVFENRKWVTWGVDWGTPAQAKSAMYDMLLDKKSRIVELFCAERQVGKVINPAYRRAFKKGYSPIRHPRDKV